MSDPIQGAGAKIAEQTVTQQGSGIEKKTPNEEDVSRFDEAINTQEQQAGTETVEAGGVSNPSSAPESLGDQILEGMKQLGDKREVQIERLNESIAKNGDEPMSIQDAMKLQFELMKLNQEQEVATKVADKSGQGVQTLLRNQ